MCGSASRLGQTVYGVGGLEVDGLLYIGMLDFRLGLLASLEVDGLLNIGNLNSRLRGVDEVGTGAACSAFAKLRVCSLLCVPALCGVVGEGGACLLEWRPRT